MRLKTLNGAPLADQLDFGEAQLIPENECNAFRIRRSDVSSKNQTVELKWRSVAPKGTRLRCGWSPPYVLEGHSALEVSEVFAPCDVANQSSSDQGEDYTELTDFAPELSEPLVVSEFMQQSFAFHDTLLSSQLAEDADGDKTISSSSFLTTSLRSTTVDAHSPNLSGTHTILHMAPTISITQLAAVPTASHLRSIYPQTPTPNFVCVLIKPVECKEIVVRRGAYKMVLYDLTLADDTTPAFRVSFWVPPCEAAGIDQTSAGNDLRRSLDSISIGSIILLRNIALTSFRNVVYGQSLKPSITRARTMIDVLSHLDGNLIVNIESLPSSVVEAFTTVKRWARLHIAATDGSYRKRKRAKANDFKAAKRQFEKSDQDEYLPPDTMESV